MVQESILWCRIVVKESWDLLKPSCQGQMKVILFTENPPPHWSELCSQNGDIFNAPEWHTVLSKGFGSNTLYGWDESTSTGLTVTIFKAGPFRIGYLAFPVGGCLPAEAISPHIIEVMRNSDLNKTIHLLRMPASAFVQKEILCCPAQATLETTIESLQEWDLTELSYNLQKAVKRAGRSPLKIVDAVNPSQGSVLFQFYKDTIKRHGGNMRYTEKYFQALIELSRTHSNLRCVLAMSGGEIAGFLAVGLHQNTAYDLHCCMNMQFRRYNPSDLLTAFSISWAKGEGMERYNLGSSPLKQASLIAYKEKWGGATREQQTYELALRPVQAAIFNASATLYERARKLLRFE